MKLLIGALSLREQVSKLVEALEAETTFEKEDPAVTEARIICQDFDDVVEEMLVRKPVPVS